MATEVGSLYYDLNIDGKKLKSQLDDADKSVKSFGSHVSQYWGDSVAASKKLLLGVAAVGAGLVGFGVSSVKAFNESQMSLTQLDAVLKSTGGTAGVTREEAIKLSREIQRQTSLSDEAALAVENMALTFTALHKEQFPKATRAAIDMATALNHGVKPSAEQSADAMKLLGKALQDPDAGLGALHRVGVNTDELAKKFVGLTDITQKQELILKELGTEFGGSAAAQAKTFAGRIDQIKNNFNDLQEQVGAVIVKALGPVADAFSRVIDRIDAAGGLLKVLQGIWRRHKDVILDVAGAVSGALTPALAAAAGALAMFLFDLAPWAIAGALAVELLKHMGVGWDDVKNAIDKIVPVLQIAWKALFQIDDVAKQLYADLIQLWQAFNRLSIIIVLSQYIQQVFWPALKAVGAAIWQNLLPALKQLWDAVVRLWNALNPGLMEALKIVGMFMGGLLLLHIYLFVTALNIVIQALSFVISVISNVINWVANLISWFGNLAGVVINTVGSIVTIFKNIVPAFKDVVGLIGAVFGAIPTLIKGLFGDAYHWLFDFGKWVLWGFKDGMLSVINSIKDAAGNISNAIKDKVKSILKIGSPSKVFEGFGRNVTEGFAKGINDSTDLAINAMGKLGNNVISPTLAVNPTNGGQAPGSTSTRFGDTIVNIGQINNKQDEDWVLRRTNRNQQLEGLGLSPVGG